MRVHDIEVDGFQDGALVGNITFVAENRRINVPLTLSETGPADSLRQHLVTQAIRLARRMPEFRSGNGTLSFAPNLLSRQA